MVCEDSTLALYFSGVSGIWGLFLSLWVLSMFKKMNLLSISMLILVLFKLINSVSLSYYFFTCDNGEVYWSLIAVCAYPLYHTFLITVIMMISKGYCIIYQEVSDYNVLIIAITLGSGYLVYSISLINSVYLSPVVSAYLAFVSFFAAKSCEQIIVFLSEKLEISSHRRRTMDMIRNRIFRFKAFKKIVWAYCIAMNIVSVVAIAISVCGGNYGEYGWYVFEILLETMRFGVACTIFMWFNPFIQMNRGFFIAISVQMPVATLLQGRADYEPSEILPSLLIPPEEIEILLATPIA